MIAEKEKTILLKIVEMLKNDGIKAFYDDMQGLVRFHDTEYDYTISIDKS